MFIAPLRYLRTSSISAGIAWMSLTVAGCGSTATSTPPLPTAAPITVTVRFGAEPVKDGSVNLVMENSGQGAFVDLDSAGTATLTDVALGSYTVVVMPPAEKDPDPENPMPVKLYNNIPVKFRTQLTSPLRADITADTTSLEFDLQKPQG